MLTLINFFNPNQFQKFKKAIDAYLFTRNYHNVQFSDAEIEQLSWYMDSKTVTPEAQEQDLIDKFHFEIKRGLARRYSLELLLRGDEQSYKEFVQSQRIIIPLEEDNKDDKLLLENPLSYPNFLKYSAMVKKLTQEELTLLKFSCLFTISDKAKQILKENNIPFSEDSEEFLSDLSKIILENYERNKKLFPLTQDLTSKQCEMLEKMFYRGLHLRHLMFAEGGSNMTQSLSEGTINGTFTEKDFELWKLRWLINLMGFKDAEVGKYFTAENEALTSMVLAQITKIIQDPNYQYLNNYLIERAKNAGFQVTTETESEAKLIGYLVSSFNEQTIITPQYGQAVLEGYKNFKEKHPNSQIIDNYNQKINDPTAVTHTYVPAILNNAYKIFKTNYNLSDNEATKLATEFMCQFLDSLLIHSRQLSHQTRISCMQAARMDNLNPVINAWHNNPASIEFKLNDKHEINIGIPPLEPEGIIQPQSALSI